MGTVKMIYNLLKVKKIFIFPLVSLMLFTTSVFADIVITGAGATFPYPLYVKWAQAYKDETGTRLNYQPIGSGGGIKQITGKTVDFGASDKPLSADELEKGGLVQFPAVVGGIVPIVNLPGVADDNIVLSGFLLADIYLGNVKKWDDPKIKALNPTISLPDRNITVVHRSDGSGTTFLFTDYLAKVNEDWKENVGSNTAVSWPSGIGGKGNEGVTSYVQRVKGAIGYVEYAYAKQSGLPFVKLKNRAGQVVSPSIESFQAAAANAKWDSQTNFEEVLTDQPGANSWPIAGATFILMRREQTKPEIAEAALNFFDWSLEHGGEMAIDLDYVPLPNAVIASIQQYWAENIKNLDGEPVWRNAHD